MPDHRIYATYRLVVVPPIEVVFPSVTYRLELREPSYPTGARLVAVDVHGDRDSREICGCATMDLLLATLSTGVSMVSPSIFETIFRRLLRERRAELVAGPHCPLYYRFDPRRSPA